MPVLQVVRKQFIKTQPFGSIRITACLPVTPETANLIAILKDGGASIALCASGTVATQDDVAAHLVRDHGIPTFAISEAASELMEQHISAALEHRPNLLIDDRGILSRRLMPDLSADITGAVEQSATGSNFAKNDGLSFPVIAAADSRTVRLVENRHGSGQVALDIITRSANILLAGQTVVIAGYGWVGRGIAERARGLGAHVLITEIDPSKALEAILEGFRVTSLLDASEAGDIIITATGSKAVLCRDHFARMKNNVILYNAGHGNVEIDVEALARLATARRAARELTEEFRMSDGRRLCLIGGGRRILFALPTPVLDIHCATTALSADYLVRNHLRMEKRIYAVPDEIDRAVARFKIDSLNAKLDRQTADQERYIPNGCE